MSVIVERPHMGWIGEHAGVGPARVEEAPLAFDEMVTRYHGRIYGYLPGMVGDTEQAQDLTQDTFLTILTIDRAKVRRHVQKRGIAATTQRGECSGALDVAGVAPPAARDARKGDPYATHHHTRARPLRAATVGRAPQ